ncbi:SCO6880 family protein [Pengzhenrongella sicca]|uniref:PrgI family protein n=1 Tax=Pengzhenrongella sicca TaxID=2819238 RepID=A0A8A4ZHQ4_9MICO|nr:SCO6880 family protein [Pengzhenrongella sicca]QTE30056.1 PrgI family protein [Pengzhenrongella sicca]
MSASIAPTPAAASTRFGRLERRGLLLGLGLAQLVVLAVALTIAVTAVYTAGMSGLLVAGTVWAPLAVAATTSVRGRSVVEWVPLLAEWQARRLVGGTTSITRPGRRLPATELALPGVAGGLMLIPAHDLGAVLIFDRRAGTVTAVVQVHGSGFLLDDAATQDQKVTGWGRVLASLCQQPAIVRVQLLHRTVPGGGLAMRAWWNDHAMAGAPWPSRILADLVAKREVTADRQETLLAVAVRVPRGNARGMTATSIGTIERHLAGLHDALTGADLHPGGWADERAIRWAIRTSYDPDAAARGHSASVHAPVSAPEPMGVAEGWTQVRTDTAVHAVYWIAEWPRSDVHPAFLQPLVLAPGARRTFALIAEPLAPGRALREIRRARAEHAADSAQRARAGQIEDEATHAELAELLRREQDLVAGHGDLRFTGLLTVTAPTPDELEQACAAAESAAAQAICEVRRLVGQQTLAHLAGAVPLARGIS